jgi:hypothetical protein
MHHSLVFYGKHQHRFLQLYCALAKLTRIPLAGRLVRWTANIYARRGHSGYYLTLTEAEKIVDLATSVSVGPCSCRKVFHRCDNADIGEIVIGDGAAEIFAGRQKELRRISREDAKELLRQGQTKHLTHSIMHCGEHFYAICSCCSCCCVPMRLRQTYGIGGALMRNPNIVEEFKSSV